MPVVIHLPTALRPMADKNARVSVDGGTVGAALEQLAARHAALRQHLYAGDGKLRNFVNVYLGETDVRTLQGPETPLKDGDELLIVPAIAGGSPVDVPPELTREEMARYNRHVIIPEVSVEGQRKLKAAKVLIVGVGGLGSPAGLYLTAAGVGRIGLVDFDKVDASNLQRQVLFDTESVGRPKLAAATERLRGLNPYVELIAHETRLTSQNALDIVKNYDLVVDGTDNFATRYLVNDACALLGKPNVYASIFRFEGQVSVFWAEKGPCYRCLYPEPPPPGLVPSCAEGGVLGVLPGIVGALQAAEAVKLIVGMGEPLIGTLLLFDALSMTFRRLKLQKDPACALCGPKRSITQLIDYEQFCNAPRGAEAKPMFGAGVPEVTVEQLKAKMEKGGVVVVDVREPHELEICRLQGTKHIPLGEVPQRYTELDPNAEILVHCRSGARSAKAVKFLRDQGYKNVSNVAGGILAWAERIDPSLQTY
ncbi:MAG: molybdopterin-synthase adenylyltransferase MoeB [Elusimicrobia bacterium]|nr:molybdopterin-synthase adenylyltransferase MoeB [Elusimicrobiota bacterium]